MSYNTFVTKENVIYTARIAERAPRGAWCVDIMEVSDGSFPPEDPLNLIIDNVKTDDIIKFFREGEEFVLIK
jgi:hypothetical protein